MHSGVLFSGIVRRDGSASSSLEGAVSETVPFLVPVVICHPHGVV